MRELKLVEGVAGRVFLHSMPGRRELLERLWEELDRHGISTILCLTGRAEIARKSPDYLEALDAGEVPVHVVASAVPDYAAPPNPEAFIDAISAVAGRVHRGESVLIHCAAGIGRTGMAAVCLLMEQGMGLEDALAAVRSAGSSPESAPQNAFLRACAARRAR